jgi:hypothetical protein
MDEPLHPSSLSEILDRTAQLYRSRFLVFLGIAVIPSAALLVLAGGAVLSALRFGSNGIGSTSPAAVGILVLAFMAGLVFVALPVFLAVTSLATAAMNHAASRAHLGQTITIRGSYKAVWRRGWRPIGLYVCELVAIWMFPIGAWTGLVVLSAGLSALAAGIGLNGGGLFVLAGVLIVVGLVTYGFWMALRLSLAFPACIVEQIGVWDSLKRSSTLTQGTKGRILLLYLLGAALNWLLSIAVTLPLTIVMALLPGSSNPKNAQTAGLIMVIVVYGAAFAVQALTRPVYGIALVLFYYDQRIRQEGFDIEWMMLKAGLIVPPSGEPLPLESLPAVTSAVEQKAVRQETPFIPSENRADVAADQTSEASPQRSDPATDVPIG